MNYELVMPFGPQDAFWRDLVTVRGGRGLEDSLWLFPVVTATILYSLCSDRGGEANLCWRTIGYGHSSVSFTKCFPLFYYTGSFTLPLCKMCVYNCPHPGIRAATTVSVVRRSV